MNMAKVDGKYFVYLATAISALGGMLFGYDIGVISSPTRPSTAASTPILPPGRWSWSAPSDLTWLFWTKRCEKMVLERSSGHAEEEVHRGADCDAASQD